MKVEFTNTPISPKMTLVPETEEEDRLLKTFVTWGAYHDGKWRITSMAYVRGPDDSSFTLGWAPDEESSR